MVCVDATRWIENRRDRGDRAQRRDRVGLPCRTSRRRRPASSGLNRPLAISDNAELSGRPPRRPLGTRCQRSAPPTIANEFVRGTRSDERRDLVLWLDREQGREQLAGVRQRAAGAGHGVDEVYADAQWPHQLRHGRPRREHEQLVRAATIGLAQGRPRAPSIARTPRRRARRWRTDSRRIASLIWNMAPAVDLGRRPTTSPNPAARSADEAIALEQREVARGSRCTQSPPNTRWPAAATFASPARCARRDAAGHARRAGMRSDRPRAR